MTLIKKLLTASLPVALVGVVTPTIVSCSCHKNGLTLKYKEQINCKDKNDTNYHKHGDVANAIKVHAAKNPRLPITSQFLDLVNNFWRDSVGQQMFYWDLAASFVILNDDNINLKNWTISSTDGTASFTLNDDEVSNKNLQYEFGIDNLIYLNYDGTQTIRSYAFSDCWKGE